MERRKATRQTAQTKPAVQSEPAEPLSHELLFEAAEAWIRALVALNPERLDERAFARVMISEALGPFDAREALEAYEFLRRMGYLDE